MHKLLLPALALVFSFAVPAAAAQSRIFTAQDFAQLKFLEGRWQGKAPHGETIYEEFRFDTPTQLRAIRYTDPQFTRQGPDNQVIALQGGVVTSTWKEFRWQATTLDGSQACFMPADGVITFCWRRVSEGRVDVVQQFKDENGRPQQYVVQLQRS